jgi:anti-sigma factor RsiW
VGGRIVDLLSSPHRAAEALMPWLLNGTLRPAERRSLEDHLHECGACRAELERQRRLASLYCDVVPAEPEFDRSAAFERLSARLDAEAAPAPAKRRARPPFGWRFVAALQLCVIAALVWTVWLLRTDALDDGTSAYRGLAASSAPASGDAIVIFTAEATESEVRHALQRAHARIVDGPTAAGAYVLHFEHGTTEAALAVLRSERSVYRVEPLTAAGAPPAASPRN